MQLVVQSNALVAAGHRADMRHAEKQLLQGLPDVLSREVAPPGPRLARDSTSAISRCHVAQVFGTGPPASKDHPLPPVLVSEIESGYVSKIRNVSELHATNP